MISTKRQRTAQTDAEVWIAAEEVLATASDSPLYRLLFSNRKTIYRRLLLPGKPGLIAARQIMAAAKCLKLLDEAAPTGKTLSSRPG